MSGRKRERRRQEKRRLRRLKMRTLFMLSLTLIFNAYAWFLYITSVSSNMTVHVESWSINFSVEDEAVEKEILFDINSAYPGMETINRTVNVSNDGKKAAEVKYIVTKVRVLDTVYVVPDQLDQTDIDQLTGREIEKTKDEMIDMLENDFPFKVNLSCSSYSLETGDSASVSLEFEWPFGTDSDVISQKDEDDTKYGVGTYEYYEENGTTKPAMQVKVKLLVKQK